MDYLRTVAAWTFGRLAEKAEDVAETLHMLADFLEYDAGGIEALRDDWRFDAPTPGWLVSNAEPAVNIHDQKRMAELRENEGRAIDYGSGSLRNIENPPVQGWMESGIGWPMPGDDYEPGNGHWYRHDGSEIDPADVLPIDGETGPMEGADS